ncbi:MAG: MmcQ/YjbR family DNA-binding protein [Saccharofermentans sp.]|nr:MmcQ/YjbR family DNA-binding protein [Saccharofermentans sp.]
MRDKLNGYIQDQYGVTPEFPWPKYNSHAVYRHNGNKKWFALIMDVGRDKLGLPGSSPISVINLKIDDIILHDIVIKETGIMPAYHMNKQHWITVLLDGTVPEDKVKDLLAISYNATAPKRRKKAIRDPKEWIIPANPKFYDVEAAFAENDIITWKQGAGILQGDTVFMYVAAPVSAILYKCRVLETDIPYDYQDKNLTITALMKIELLKCYDRDAFTFSVLGDEYGIYAIRGPRGVPFSLSEALNG